jgi:hypothetical protein
MRCVTHTHTHTPLCDTRPHIRWQFFGWMNQNSVSVSESLSYRDHEPRKSHCFAAQLTRIHTYLSTDFDITLTLFLFIHTRTSLHTHSDRCIVFAGTDRANSTVCLHNSHAYIHTYLSTDFDNDTLKLFPRLFIHTHTHTSWHTVTL